MVFTPPPQIKSQVNFTGGGVKFTCERSGEGELILGEVNLWLCKRDVEERELVEMVHIHGTRHISVYHFDELDCIVPSVLYRLPCSACRVPTVLFRLLLLPLEPFPLLPPSSPVCVCV